MLAANTITLTRIHASGSTVRFEFASSGKVAEAFKRSSFTVDYFEDISDVPMAVLAVVFAVNVLPVAWVYDADLIIPELDHAFLESVDKFKKGFISMYPKATFGGRLIVNEVIKSTPVKPPDVAALLLFSGGVDAATSLIRLLEKGVSPVLMTVWGADLGTDDNDAWAIRAQLTQSVAKQFGLRHSFVKSGFRTFLREDELSNKVWSQLNDGWWHGLQHGIGLIGHVAPYVYKHGIESVYIASSYTRGETYTCASDPTIDNYVRFGGTRIIHDGYELSRQDKIHTISRFVEAKNAEFPLIVCWESTSGQNCGKCEKCMRTAAGFIAEGLLPDRFSIVGFDAKYLKKFLLRTSWVSPIVVPGWKSIQNAIHDGNLLFSQKRYDIRWLKAVDMDHINDVAGKRVRRLVWHIINVTLKNRVVRPLSGLLRKSAKA